MALITALAQIALAQQATGTVTKVDEEKGTISIQLTQSGAVEEFEPQDGLLFNAVRPGDKVSFTVFESNGTKKITKLSEE